MRKYSIWSDQLYDWPDTAQRTRHCLPQAQAQYSVEKTTSFEKCSPWIVNRAIQTLRKARMQMLQGTRAWTEVFTLGQPAWGAPQAGIRPKTVPGTGHSLSGQFPFIARNYRGDLQYQPRVIASQRTFIGRNIVRFEFIQCAICRHRSSRHIGCQHARNIAQEKQWRAFRHGGQ